MTRNEWIKVRLEALLDAGRVNEWYSQTGMPGRRWHVGIPGSSRSFTTAEVEAFLTGATMP